MKTIWKQLLRGALGGAAATVTMTAALGLFRFTGLLGEPPPKKLTRRIFKTVGINLGRGAMLDVVTAATHLGYGVASGALYTLLPGRERSGSIVRGATYGAAIWAASYMGWIPRAGLMSRPSVDRPGRPTSMILAHLVFGATLAAAQRVMSPRIATPPQKWRVATTSEDIVAA